MLEALPSLRHLQVLGAVARLNSITQAASAIHLTQPAVTQVIAKMEASAGAKLFERRITGTYLTTAGELYLERTELLFKRVEVALQIIQPDVSQGELTRRAGKFTRAQIRALIAISQSQSQGQAANILGISQASLHRAARDLERNVGATLYHRATTGVMTTAAGQILANCLQLAVSELDEICDEIRTTQQVSARCIRIGTLMLDPAALLGSAMVEFTRDYPGTVVRVVQAPFDSLCQKLRAGTIDCIVGVSKPIGNDLIEKRLFSDPYVVAARRDHPLASRDNITAADLLDYDWIVTNQSAPRHIAFNRLFAKAGREPSMTIETHSMATIRVAVSNSNRLTILMRSELKAEEPSGIIAALPFAKLGPDPVIAVTTRRDWIPSAEKQAFLDLLHDRARRLEQECEALSSNLPPKERSSTVRRIRAVA